HFDSPYTGEPFDSGSPVFQFPRSRDAADSRRGYLIDSRPISKNTNLVPIANPVDGRKYTSWKRAVDFIDRGRAELVDGHLWFFDAATLIERRRQKAEEQELAAHRSGILHWNGSADPKGQRRPGEVRS